MAGTADHVAGQVLVHPDPLTGKQEMGNLSWRKRVGSVGVWRVHSSLR